MLLYSKRSKDQKDYLFTSEERIQIVNKETNPNFAEPGKEPKPGQSTPDGDHLTSKKPEKEKEEKKASDKNKELDQSIDTLEQETFSKTETEPSDEDFEESKTYTESEISKIDKSELISILKYAPALLKAA